jgi:allantoicase
MHYGHPRNILRSDHGTNMGDGWETARQPTRPPVLKIGADGNIENPGCDWVVIELGSPGKVNRLEVDTSFFKGNYPESFQVECCTAGWKGALKLDAKDIESASWKVRRALNPPHLHRRY